MGEATCDKCGLNDPLDDAEVSPSGTAFKCGRCGHAITVAASFEAITDLPAPVGPLPTRGRTHQLPDPLVPVGPSVPPISSSVSRGAPVGTRVQQPPTDKVDLPAPVGPLPTRQLLHLLAPVGPSETQPASADQLASAAVLRDLGRTHLAMRNLGEAVSLLERAAAARPSDPDTHYALGTAYHELERVRPAAQHLAWAVELATEATPWRAEAYRLLGWAQRAVGDTGAAAAAWRRYLNLDATPGLERQEVERLLRQLRVR